MDASGSERDPVEVLADEFVQRRRRGERPNIAEYTLRHPQLADEIRNAFPVLLALEEAVPSGREGASGAAGLASPLDPQPSSLGDYRILREIGRGAMGVVYEAEQQSLDRRVALKILPWHATTSGVAVERFRREARAAAKLHHTNIVPVFDVGQEANVCYYAMQFIQGQPLDKVLEELSRLRSGGQPSLNGQDSRAADGNHAAGQEMGPPLSQIAFSLCRPEFASPAGDSNAAAAAEGGLSNDTSRLARESTRGDSARKDGSRSLIESSRSHYYRSVAHACRQVADALEYAHSRGIIHRDIKPSNLLLDGAGVVWVTDFGLAKTEDAAITRTGDLLGTLRYMAPERFSGECDAQADVYSLGATLYELVTHRPAHDGRDSADLISRICHSDPTPPRQVEPKVPRDLELIVLKALDRDRHQRYESASALAEDLRRFLNDEPIVGRRTPLAERFARWARHNRTLAAVTVTVAVLLSAAAVISGIASASFLSLATQERQARLQTTTNLYDALVREAEAIRLARREGYRAEVWSRVDQARKLDTPAVDASDLRRLAAESLGDFVGLAPTVLTGFPAEAHAIALGGEPPFVAVGLADGTIRFHDAASGKLLAEHQAHFAAVDRLAWLADTATLYSADARGTVKAWKRNGDAWDATRLGDVDAPLLALVAVRDGELMAAHRRYHSEIVVQNLAGQHRAVVVDPGLPVAAAAISGRGNLLAAIAGNEIFVYETRSGGLIERTTTDLGPLLGVAFSEDGQLLFCGCDQGLVIYDLPELRQQTFMRYDQAPAGAFSPDSSQLAFASRNRRITLWNFRGNRELAVLTHPGWHDIHSVAFAADGKLLAAADAQAVRVWNVAGSGERRVLAGHAAGINDIAFSRDAERMATASKDRTIAIWDAESGEQQTIAAMPAPARSVSFGGQGTLLAAGDQSGTLRLYETKTLHSLVDVRHSLGAIESVRFSPGGEYLAAAGANGMALWQIHNPGENLRVEQRHSFAIRGASGVRFSPDGQLVAWVNDQLQVEAMATASGVRWPLGGSPLLRRGHKAAFVDSRRLVFADRQGRLVAWDIITDREELAIDALHDFPGGHLAAGSQGRLLALDLRPLQMAVWNLATGQPLLAFREEQAAISATAWSEDSRLLAVGTQDGGLAIWNLTAVRKELATLELDWSHKAPPSGDDEAKTRSPLEALTAAIEQQPDDAKLLVRRGQILVQHDQLDDALADFTRVLEQDERNITALIGRGDVHARQGRDAEAAADYRRTLALDPSRFGDWFATSVLLAKAGEAKEYREHCSEFLARFGAQTDPSILERTVLACVLLPDAVPPQELPAARLEALLLRADLSAEFRCRAWTTLALAAMRSGDPDRALANIRLAQEESVYSETPAIQALSFFVQALAQHQRGQLPLAAASLSAGRDFLRVVPRHSASGGRDPAAHDHAILPLLQDEAEQRLGH